MKRNELKDKLIESGIPSYLYDLDINRKGTPDERLCLEFADNEWRVYFTERGIRTTNLVFSSEDEACQYMYDELP